MDMEVTRTAIRLFELEIHWYGVLIVAGIGLGVWLAWKREGRMGLPRETVLDLALVCVPLALVGAHRDSESLGPAAAHSCRRSSRR